MNCLILDDNPADIALLRDILLKSFATNIVGAGTIDEAIRVLAEMETANSPFELAFVDLGLSLESGLEFVSYVFDKGLPIAIILLTGIDDGAEFDRAKSMGIDIISKSELQDDKLVQAVCLKSISRWIGSRREQSRIIEQHSQDLLRVSSEIAHQFLDSMHKMKSSYTLLGKYACRQQLTEDFVAAMAEELKPELEYLDSLVKRICSFESMGAREAELEDQEIGELIRELVTRDLHSPQTTNIVGPNQRVRFAIDKDIVRHVLRILSDNCQKYCPEGYSVSIAYRIEFIDASPTLVIDFEDNGPGIPADYRDRIFLAANRGPTQSTDTRPSSGGWGLGLAAARKALGQHTADGRIAQISCVEPIRSSGACFRLTFPSSSV